MKKIFISIISIMMVFSFLATDNSLAVSDTKAQVKIDGKNVILDKIKVNVDGRAIKTDVPAVNYEGNTIVPIRFVSEELGAEVTWDQKNRIAIIKTQDKNIELKIDSPKAIVNGKEQTLPNNAITKIVSTEASAESQRTMVPLRFVSETLGAEVEWVKETKTANIKSNNKVENSENKIQGIEEQVINGKKAIVIKNTYASKFNSFSLTDPDRIVVDISNTDINNIESTISTDIVKNIRLGQHIGSESDPAEKVARLVLDVSGNLENISYKVEPRENDIIVYIEKVVKEANKLQSISKQMISGKEAIVIKNSSASKFNTFNLTEPDRVVVDVRDTDMNNVTGNISTDVVKELRFSQYSGSEYDASEKVTRFVLDIKDGYENIKPKIEQSGNDLVIYIDADKKGPNKIQSIEKKTIYGKEAIVIKNSSASKFNTFTLTEPDRIVVDVRNTDMNDVVSNISTDVIKELRLSQYEGSEYDPSEKVTRFVLDIKENYENIKSRIEEHGDDLIIYVEGNKQGPNTIQAIEKQMINGKEAIVIKNSNVSKFKSFSLDSPSRLVVDVRNTDMNNVTCNISTKVVKTVRHSQYEGSEYDASEKVSRLVLDLKDNYENIKSTVEAKGKDIIIYVDGTEKTTVTPPVVNPPVVVPPVVKPPVVVPPKNGKTIVIDAGHGGHDGGAAANGIKEKDVALKASLKTREKLELLGYKVIMTRTTDVYPSLSNRYQIANNNKADAFLSVHFNSATPAATGIETLYSTKNSKNKAFANTIQNELIYTTGARDRGPKLRNDLAVLNGTKGVSALAELGFITNPKDAHEMKFGDYIEKCATALTNGLHKFFSK